MSVSVSASWNSSFTFTYILSLLSCLCDATSCSDPQFVSAFDVGDFVYFFFREHSLEHANCGRVTYSRVARLCKV